MQHSQEIIQISATTVQLLEQHGIQQGDMTERGLMILMEAFISA